MLLARPNVKLNISDRTGCTALHLAVEGKNFKALETLLDYSPGADADVDTHLDLDVSTKKGMTALALAAAKRDCAMVNRLAAKGATMDIKDNMGLTPLMHACCTNGGDMVQCLLGHGAGLNEVDRQKRSALHWAARKGNAIHTEILLAAGCNAEIRDSDNCTALEQAIWKNQTSVINAYVNESRCSILIRLFGYGKLQLSAYDLARTRGNKVLMDLLFEATQKELLGLMRACGVNTRYKISPDLMCIIAEFAV